MTDFIQLSKGAGGDKLFAPEILDPGGTTVKQERISIDFSGPQHASAAYILSSNGDPDGPKQATGNYSGGATMFYVEPAVEIQVIGLSMMLNDESGKLEQGGYGASGSDLTNGITWGSMLLSDHALGAPFDTWKLDYLLNGRVKDNLSWGIFGRFSVFIEESAGSGKGYYACGIDFPTPIVVKGPTEIFGVRLEDNFSALTDHVFAARVAVPGLWQ